jgi:glutamyl-tRNA synthetase
MSVRVRFAPSPTGFLHVGGARTALYNYLFARAHGGKFVLRVEDTDAARSNDESVRAILDSLRWLGLTWDEGPEVGGMFGPYFQAQRRELYARHATTLQSAGRAYPCYCTPEELEAMREAQAANKQALRYDGRCRALSPDERAQREAKGRRPALRFALDPAGETTWDDIVRGRVAFRNELLDDFVLLRSDGLPTYNYACVVDDYEMQITHVIRGDDHISNTPRQLQIYAAFGWTAPQLAHVPMILGPDGSRLSKRHGATSVEAFRDLGIVPQALDNFLALLGWAFDGTREVFTLAELEQAFKLERVGANPATFNREKLEWINFQHLKRESEDTRARLVREFLAGRGVNVEAHPAEWWTLFVRALGDRLRTLVDAENYGRFALEDPLEVEPEAWTGVIERPGAGDRLEGLAARVEADAEFSLESLERISRDYAAESGLKAGELIALARVALTGRKVSPGIFEVMALLGKARVVARLRDAAARWRAEAGAARA